MTVKQQIKKLRKFDVISINWVDITADCSWMDENKMKEFSTSRCVTVGFFISREGSNIKTSYSYNFDDNTGAIEIIPIGVISSIKNHGKR